MPRVFDPARRCLHVRDWPDADQALWQRAFAACDPEDEARSSAADWRPTTVQTNREGYGRWINYLKLSGCDLQETPAGRVTPARVRGYLTALREQGVSIRSRCNRISELLSVMMAIAPEQDWTWLKRRFIRLDALAKEAHQCTPLTLLSGDILDKARKALTSLTHDGPKPSIGSATLYRNWLMLAMNTLVPLRRHNFATLSINGHMRRVGKTWSIEIPPGEAKTAKPIVMPIPPILHPFLDFYLERIRPTLLHGSESDRLWITWRQHSPMTAHSYYIAMTNFTRRVFGTPINPQRFRHIGATTTVIAAPEKMEAARAFLGHGDAATTKDNYIIGQSVAASRVQATLVARLRRTMPGAKRARSYLAPQPKLA